MKKIAKSILALVLVSVLALSTAALADPLQIGIPALRIISISFIFASVTMSTGYIASGLGDGMTNMVGSLLRQFLPLIPCAYLLAKLGGIDNVWYAIWISELTAFLFALIRIRQLKAKL